MKDQRPEDSQTEHSKSHKRKSHAEPFWHRHRKLWIVLAGVIVVLGILRAVLPHIVRRYVNDQLQKSGSYAGSVGDIGISLWRGAYQIQNINIYKRNGKIREPFFSSPLLDFSVQWPALVHGRIVARVYMQQPRLNFVTGPTPQQSQAGENTPWNAMLQNLAPFKLNEVEIHDGEIHYKDDYSDPKVDIYFSQLGAAATNLSNIENKNMSLPAGIRANAKTIGGGSMSFQLQLNPVAPAPDYQLQASLTNVYLPALNNFLRAYGKFDVAQGDFAMFMSVAATNEAYQGYIKILFKNLDVFEWKKERHKNILKIFWEAIVGAASTILRNQPQDQLATKIPISGVYTNTTVDLDATIGSLLRNAFVRALLPKYDQKVTTGQVAQAVKSGNIPNSTTNGTPSTNGGMSFTNQPMTPIREKHPGTMLEAPETGTNVNQSPP